MQQKHFSIIIPCFNEESSVEDTVSTISEILPDLDSYDIIMVNDGSTDRTGEILRSLPATYPNLIVQEHANNRGYGAALKTGIRRSTTELIVITDADGTYPLDMIPELVDQCGNYDMVVGARTGQDVQYSNIRAIPKYFLRNWMSWIAGSRIPDINSGLRVFRKSVAEQFFGIFPDGFSFTVTITLAMLTNYRPTLFVPISYRDRVGKSKIKPVRDTLRFCMLILRTGVYFAPMRTFFPLFALLLSSAFISFGYDIVVLRDLTEKTLLLFFFALNVGMFSLLADMIDKRSLG